MKLSLTEKRRWVLSTQNASSSSGLPSFRPHRPSIYPTSRVKVSFYLCPKVQFTDHGGRGWLGRRGDSVSNFTTVSRCTSSGKERKQPENVLLYFVTTTLSFCAHILRKCWIQVCKHSEMYTQNTSTIYSGKFSNLPGDCTRPLLFLVYLRLQWCRGGW